MVRLGDEDFNVDTDLPEDEGGDDAGDTDTANDSGSSDIGSDTTGKSIDDYNIFSIGDTVSDENGFGHSVEITVNDAWVQDDFDGITTDGCGWGADYSEYLADDGKIYETYQYGTLGDGINTLDHRCQYDLEGFSERNVFQLIGEEDKEFSQTALILIAALFHRNHEISGDYDRHMGCQRIIRKAVAFRDQPEIGLAGFEEHFDLPAFSIDPDDFFL